MISRILLICRFIKMFVMLWQIAYIMSSVLNYCTLSYLKQHYQRMLYVDAMAIRLRIADIRNDNNSEGILVYELWEEPVKWKSKVIWIWPKVSF